MQRLPLIAPRPLKLSEQGVALRRVEASGLFSNHGPEARAFEADATARLFGGRGHTLAVANATLGLMLAIRDAVGGGGTVPDGADARAHLCRDRASGLVGGAGAADLRCRSGRLERERGGGGRLLHLHGSRIAVLVPYATFGYPIDLDRYVWLAKRHNVAVVIVEQLLGRAERIAA